MQQQLTLLCANGVIIRWPHQIPLHHPGALFQQCVMQNIVVVGASILQLAGFVANGAVQFLSTSTLARYLMWPSDDHPMLQEQSAAEQLFESLSSAEIISPDLFCLPPPLLPSRTLPAHFDLQSPQNGPRLHRTLSDPSGPEQA